MSAVAIHFDPTFNMGPRSAFAWPGTFESSHSAPSMLGQDFSAVLSDPSVSPSSTSRSLTSSPPRTILTPEQRELKRQRDRARRDSRVSTRMHRADSVSYMSSSPMAMSDATSAMALPVYTTAPGAVSVLAESATTLASQSYIPSYNTPLQDQTQAQVFTSPYQQPLQPTYSMSMEYPTAYAGHSEYSLQSSLPTVGQDGSMMYRMPAVMVTSSSAGTPTAVTSNGGSNGAQESSSHVRVVQSRPKPRCWEHGCNGRQFSTFSNLLRHQREKSGQAAKATCPNCGAEFTRTTARNGHLLHDKCKQRRNT